MLKLDENFSIEPDLNNFTLKFSQDFFNEKTGKDSVRTNEWYCVDVSHALKVYLRESVRLEVRKDNATIEKVLKRIEEVEKLIDKKFK